MNPKSLLSVEQFDTHHIHKLFQLTQSLESNTIRPQLTQGCVSTNLFYEPSTRTSSSFYSAMVKLGGNVIPINDVSFSSVSKGETLEDTIRVMQGYSDVIVLRHPEMGACVRAAAVSQVPIINAGDGVGEHPTQALLDLYTIHKHMSLNKPLHVALVGDLKHGRTVHSLLRLLRMYDVHVHLIAPPGFEMPEYLVQPGDEHHTQLWTCMPHVDVVYMTRVQKERITDTQLLMQIHDYKLTPALMHMAKPDMIVMHPLPRVDEIDHRVDADPRAKYFEQITNGLWIRQAIFVNMFMHEHVCWVPFST
jgi:aspartate carbamoyltransferase